LVSRRHWCSHAIHIARSVIDTLGGSTVNVAALDISLAFDRVDHSGLPILEINERASSQHVVKYITELGYYTCVRWCSAWSSFFRIKCGVRQGGVFSGRSC